MSGLKPVSFAKSREHAPRLTKPYVPGRTSERFWTEEEDDILRKYYPEGGMPAAGARLPNRDRSAIYCRAKKLGLKRTDLKPHESIDAAPDLDDTLRARWPEMTSPGDVRRLAEELGVPRWWLSRRARHLELTVARKKEPNWTPAEEALMHKIPLHDLDKCAGIFRDHGFVRTPTSINVKAKRMNLSRRATRTNFSGTSAAKLLGLDTKTVTAWCVAGDIEATRRGTQRLPQQGGDAWDIQPADLRQFILDNLARIDIRKVEKVSFCELLARCPNCATKGEDA